MCFLVPYVHVSDTSLTVKDVFHDGACDFRNLATPLLPDAAQHLLALCVHTRPAQDDLMVWTDSLDGVSRWPGATLGFRLEGQILLRWCLGLGFGLWKVVVPENVKVFVWQALHNSLPVSVVLAHRGVPLSDRCQLCNSLPESSLHCLHDCARAVQVWHNLSLSLRPGFFDVVSFRDWVDSIPSEQAASLLIHV